MQGMCLFFKPKRILRIHGSLFGIPVIAEGMPKLTFLGLFCILLVIWAGPSFGAKYSRHCSLQAIAEFPAEMKVPIHRVTVTQDYMTYLAYLLDKGVLGDKNLARLLAGNTHPISPEELTQRPELAAVSEIFNRFNSYTLQIHHDQIRSWAQLEWNFRTHSAAPLPLKPLPIEFSSISDLRKPIFVSTTPVTQWQYTWVTGKHPSHFAHGDETVFLPIAGQLRRMQPNHPVESVSRQEIQSEFLSRINLWSEKQDASIFQIIPLHKAGTRYRLPKPEELEALPEIKDSWMRYKYAYRTHGVRSGPSAALYDSNSAEFYAVGNNVLEFTNQTAHAGFADVFGGSWYSPPVKHGRTLREHYRSAEVGFRIVAE